MAGSIRRHSSPQNNRAANSTEDDEPKLRIHAKRLPRPHRAHARQAAQRRQQLTHSNKRLTTFLKNGLILTTKHPTRFAAVCDNSRNGAAFVGSIGAGSAIRRVNLKTGPNATSNGAESCGHNRQTDPQTPERQAGVGHVARGARR